MTTRAPLLALGTLLASLGGAAAAQGVSIYGITDAYVGHVSGSESRTVLREGAHTASRVGFRGREDLGRGLSAYFTLEMGLTLDNGTIPLGGGFGRQSFVGLGGRWGTIELGRQYTPIFYNMLAVAPFGMNANWAPVQLSTSKDGLPAAARALGFPLRQNNLVRYRYGGLKAKGFRFEAAYAPGENEAASGSLTAVAASYRGANYFIGYGAQRSRSGTGAATGFHNQLQGVSGSYTWNALTLSAQYLVTDSSLAGARRADHVVLGAAYAMGPHTLLAEVNRRNLRDSPDDALLVTLGYDYNLSKRTALYARLLHLDNRGSAANTMAQATVRAGSGDDVRAVAFGIRHKF